MALKDMIISRIESQSQNPELQRLVNLHAVFLTSALESMGLKEFQVETTIHSVQAADYANQLTLGIGTNFEPEKLAVFLAGSTQSPSSEQAIIPMLLLPGEDGTEVLADKNSETLFASGFWVCKDKKLQYTHPSQPVQLDGLLTMYDTNVYKGYEAVIDTNERLDTVTLSKQQTKDILTKAGILVPPGICIRHTESQQITVQFANLSSTFDITDGIVVKDDTGDFGDGVKLFKVTELDKAQAFAQELITAGKDVVVEKRIIPMEPQTTRRIKRALHMEHPDHNSRVLVTLSTTNPTVIDALERIKEFGEGPVNISKGASVYRLGNIYTPTVRHTIYKTAEAATKAVCQAIAKTSSEVMIGFAGIDIMTDRDGNVYVLEVNGGPVGGFEDLTQLNKKPLASLSKIFYPYARKFLQRNHERRIDIAQLQLERIPNRIQDTLNVIKLLLFKEYPQEAKELLHTLSSIPKEYGEFVKSLVKGFINYEYQEEANYIQQLVEK